MERALGPETRRAVKKVKVVLGADPEFELVCRGWIVGAGGFLGAEIDLPWGTVGTDGDQLELRPRPSADPEALVRNLGRLLLSVLGTVGGVPSTVCKNYPIGGHVHIGGVPEGARESVTKAVDEGLGDLFHSLNAETRLRTGYGQRGDWRPQLWGVEYRTPPASLWSHPTVALIFLRAIKWVAKRFLFGEDPFRNSTWSTVRAVAEKATEFVREHGGRLHWGAWKSYIGEFLSSEVKVSLDPETEHDEAFLDDLRAMCARLGIPSVRVIPLQRSRGDHASNVLWYEESEFAVGFERYGPGEGLALSWRFRNDPLFRRGEIPKMERAIARLLEMLEEDDGGLLVREVVPFSVEWPLETGAEDGEEEPWVPGDEGRICGGCGAQVEEAWLGELGEIYCKSCYDERYTRCAECDRKVKRGEVEKRNGLDYCPSCYASLFAPEEEGEVVLRG